MRWLILLIPCLAFGQTIPLDVPQSTDSALHRDLAVSVREGCAGEQRHSVLQVSAWDGQTLVSLLLPPINGCHHEVYKKDGGLEWEMHFANMAPPQTMRFPLAWRGVTFNYQGLLTAEEIEEGCRRPDSIINSYAIYGKRAGNYHSRTHSEIYMTGKMCHLYRSWIRDGDGRRHWIHQVIDTLSREYVLVIPDHLYVTAPPPWIVGPHFGPDTVGGSSGNPQNCYGYIQWHDDYTFTPSADTTLDSIFIYAKGILSTGTLFLGCYNRDDSTLVDTLREELPTDWTSRWEGGAFPNADTLLNGVKYAPAYSAFQPDDITRIELTYDIVASGNVKRKSLSVGCSSANDAILPDPSGTFWLNYTILHSLFCVYGEPGSEAESAGQVIIIGKAPDSLAVGGG